MRFILFILLCSFVGVNSLPYVASAATSLGLRPFKGSVRQEQAIEAATVASMLEAVHGIEKQLATHAAFQFILQNKKEDTILLPDLSGLALQLATMRVKGHKVRGFPPHLEVGVELEWELPTPLHDPLVEALRDVEHIELYTLVVQRLEALLKEYESLAIINMDLMPQSPGGQQQVLKLGYVVRSMKGTRAYLDFLPHLRGVWESPEKVQEELEKALQLDPENPLILVGLAEAMLQLDSPMQAQQLVIDALELAPRFAKAYDVKGAVLLRQRLPALAVAAFSEAILLSPQFAPYYIHRAAANLVQEETEQMCVDLISACVLHNCEELEWARGAGQCLQSFVSDVQTLENVTEQPKLDAQKPDGPAE